MSYVFINSYSTANENPYAFSAINIYLLTLYQTRKYIFITISKRFSAGKMLKKKLAVLMTTKGQMKPTLRVSSKESQAGEKHQNVAQYILLNQGSNKLDLHKKSQKKISAVHHH